MEKNYNRNIFFTFILILIVFVTNNFFNYEDSLIHGGNDGKFYILISEYSPNFGNNIEFIKGERFFLPYVLGLINKLTSINLYFLYQISSIILISILIFLYLEILELTKVKGIIYYISLLLVIFNPYLIRYYLAVPTIIVDLGFIISLEIIAIGFLKKKKHLFIIGMVIALISRQNAIIILFSFFLIKLFFKKKSFIKYKDLLYLGSSFILVFLINTYYAVNSSGDVKEVENLYITTLFGILIFDYNLKDFFRYLYFPLLGFGPLILYFFTLTFLKRLHYKNNEFTIFLIIVSVLLISIAFVGGPTTTGKNLIRLANFSFIYLILIINSCIFRNINGGGKINLNYIFFGFILFLWSLHPTFSKIKLWKFLNGYINF